MVYVKWMDSSSVDRWLSKEEANKLKNLECESVGFLIKKTKNKLVLAASKSASEYGSTWVIPMVCVKKIKKIKIN